MESQNMDNQFKKIMESSENHYKEYSDKASNYIWHEINKGKSKPILFLWKQIAVAATILLLLSLSLGLYYSKKQTNALVAELNSQMDMLKRQNIAQKQKPAPIIKTVTIVKKRIVNIPVVKTEIIEKVKYIQDTVFVKQLVVKYREMGKDISNDTIKENLKHEETRQETPFANTEFILARNSKKKKKEAFSLEQFLSKRYNAESNTETSSIVVITTKL